MTTIFTLAPCLYTPSLSGTMRYPLILTSLGVTHKSVETLANASWALKILKACCETNRFNLGAAALSMKGLCKVDSLWSMNTKLAIGQTEYSKEWRSPVTVKTKMSLKTDSFSMYSHIKNKVIRNTSAILAGFLFLDFQHPLVGKMFRFFNEFGHLVQLHVHEVPQFRLGKTFKAFGNLPWWCPERLSPSDPFQSCAKKHLRSSEQK